MNDSDDSGRKRMLAELIAEMDISDVMNIYIHNGRGFSKRLLKFFRWSAKWVPLTIMVTHAYGMWEFSTHPREMFILQSGNMACYIFIYAMVYVLPMMLILASRFFWLCWRYRIPFFYYIGVNSIHIGYGSIFTTNDMIPSQHCLCIMTLGFYIYGFTDMFLRHTNLGKRLFR